MLGGGGICASLKNLTSQATTAEDDLWDSENRCFNQENLKKFVNELFPPETNPRFYEGEDSLFSQVWTNTGYHQGELDVYTGDGRQVVIGNYLWDVVCISLNDHDGVDPNYADMIVTLMLAEDQPYFAQWCQQVEESGYMYAQNFSQNCADIELEGSSYDDFDYGNIVGIDAYTHDYTDWDKIVYSRSKIRAFVLNNNQFGYSNNFGDVFNMQLIHPFSLFTVPDLGFTRYIEQPRFMLWQCADQGVDYTINYFYNDLLNDLNVASTNWETVEVDEHYSDWGSDFLWLPSYSEASLWEVDSASDHFILTRSAYVSDWLTDGDGLSGVLEEDYRNSGNYIYGDDYMIFSRNREIESRHAFETVLNNGGAYIRPCFHFNLSKAVYAGGDPVINLDGFDENSVQSFIDILANEEGASVDSIIINNVQDGYGAGAKVFRTNSYNKFGGILSNGEEYYGNFDEVDDNLYTPQGNDIYVRLGGLTWTVVHFDIDDPNVTLWLKYDDIFDMIDRLQIIYSGLGEYGLLNVEKSINTWYAREGEVCTYYYESFLYSLLNWITYQADLYEDNFLPEFFQEFVNQNLFWDIISSNPPPWQEELEYQHEFGEGQNIFVPLWIPSADEAYGEDVTRYNDFRETDEVVSATGGVFETSIDQRGRNIWFRHNNGEEMADALDTAGRKIYEDQNNNKFVHPAIRLDLVALLNLVQPSETVTIELDKQNGVGGDDSITAETGAMPSRIQVPSRSGYDFEGYYTQINGGGKCYFSSLGSPTFTRWESYASNIPKVLYAHWTQRVVPTPKFSGGSGTVSSPYLISTPADLDSLSNAVNGGNEYSNAYFRQTANLDLTTYTNFTPIGNGTYSFQGNYDGQHYNIKNLKENTSSNGGLFGTINGATITNLIFAKCSITAVDCAGTVAGVAYSADISNITNGSDVTVNSASSVAGGIVGRTYTSILLQKCINQGNVTAGVSVSGLIGEISSGSGSLNQCISEGVISASNSACTTGSFVGCKAGSGTLSITDCASLSDFSGTAASLFASMVGNITSGSTTIMYCFYRGGGPVSRSIPFVNGSATITACYSVYLTTNKKISTALTDKSWTNNWAVVPSMNNGLPIQKGLFQIANAVTNTTAELQTALSGFTT